MTSKENQEEKLTYYQKNRERILAERKADRLANPEKYKAIDESRKEYKQEWHKRNYKPYRNPRFLNRVCPQCNQPVETNLSNGVCKKCDNRAYYWRNRERVLAQQAGYRNSFPMNYCPQCGETTTRKFIKMRGICINCYVSNRYHEKKKNFGKAPKTQV